MISSTQHFVLFLIFIVLLSACKSGQKFVYSKKSILSEAKLREINSDIVVGTARNYLGVSYKYGGTNAKGMDCSGLVYLSYKEIGLVLPRVSRDQAKAGKSLSISQLKRGDLVFFATGKGKMITHVGIVSEINKGRQEIIFIHTSSSRGVCEDRMEGSYWKKRFVKAVRIF